MRNRIIYIFLILICACSSQLKERGEITLLNGENKEVKVQYQIFELSKFTAKHSMKDFEAIATKAGDKAKSLCKNKLTYEPKSFSLIQSGDTITINFDMVAKNGFGVPQEQRVYVDFLGTTLIGYDAF